MRKTIVLLAAALVAATFAGPSASAKPKPVKTTFYLHGNYPLGYIDGADWLANSTPPMSMNPTKPTDAQPKLMGVSAAAFNDQCTGLPSAFPTWVGNVSGTIVGDAHLHLHYYGGPSTLTIRIWADIPVFSCNENYIAPAQEIAVDVPAGHQEVDAVFKNLKLKAQSQVMIEVLDQSATEQAVIAYDSTDLASMFMFDCIPAKGKVCG
jgi:hypothetical protein